MNKYPEQICEFEASHCRTGVIWIEEFNCDKCNKKRRCLCIDSSEGEYGEGSICFECIEEAKGK